ncbi:ECF transporter S component [Paracoccus lutimaris]|uniref:Energy-coupling factor transport system substrate-specific component n=1 Tax=Paracoccus lutimaris TaxID=1490030 RepID=A0A368YNH7_9RHOB|nr:ECF transporter S component [Paracoccus lutimaris]RCW81745.1 energy-coupling factor transport system substrate-specific component [Paracoccus lutimaris]
MSQPIFSTRVLVLMAIGIALNMALGQLVSLLKLPVFLDSLGTMLVAVLCGPWIGGLTGLVTNLLWGLIQGPTVAFFAPVAAVIGIVAGLLARAGLFRTPIGAAASGAIIAVTLAFIAVPIRIYLFGGVTGSGADFLIAYLTKVGQDLVGSVIVTVITANLADKIVTALLVWGIIRGLPQRTASDWPFLAHSRD